MNKLNPKAVVITPTIGTAHLHNALESVQSQIYKDLIHLIIVDGENHAENVNIILKNFDKKTIKLIVLPFNTGSNGFNGHRIYAACAYLVNSDYIFFLDEDNWFDDNHVSSLIKIIEDENLDWAYSLRKICSHTSEYIITDDCESLGRWPPLYHPEKAPHSSYPHLVDTSCYALKQKVLRNVGHFWDHPLGADRVLFKHLSELYPYFNSTSLYSLNYRLHQNRPPSGDFYKSSRSIMLERYGNNLPWLEY